MTNLERIQKMSAGDLVRMLGHDTLCDYIQEHDNEHCLKYKYCSNCLVDWLDSEVKKRRKDD